MNIQKNGGSGRGLGGWGDRGRGQAVCEQRIEVFVKIKKKWGVRSGVAKGVSEK